MSSSVAAPSIIYVGMDVHKDSITIAVLPMAGKNPTRLERIPNAIIWSFYAANPRQTLQALAA